MSRKHWRISEKKIDFYFPNDGGMSNATKTISTMSKKNKKNLRDTKKNLRKFQEMLINVKKTPKEIEKRSKKL